METFSDYVFVFLPAVFFNLFHKNCIEKKAHLLGVLKAQSKKYVLCSKLK